jgi:VWFA-related protein
MRRIVIVSCSCLLIAIALVAQDIPPDELHWGSRPYSPDTTYSIRVRKDLVEVATVVRDSRGNAVGNMQKSDFLVFDNGKPQTISSFAVLTGLEKSAVTEQSSQSSQGGVPNVASTTQARYVALFFDDVNTTLPNLIFARDGAIKFIRKGLDAEERVGIFTASGTLTLDFTEDVQKLLDTLGKLRVLEKMPDQGPDACPQLDAYQAWVIRNMPGVTIELQRAIDKARECGCASDPVSCVRKEANFMVGSAEGNSRDTFISLSYAIRHLGDMPGRRSLVLASSGFLALSLGQEQQKVIEAALRANVVINSLSTSGVGGGTNPFTDPLANLAGGTSGQYVHDNNDIGTGFYILSAMPSVSYILGFSPENLTPDGKLHNLKVKLAEPSHLSVRARTGYYAPSPELSPAEIRYLRLQKSVMANDKPAEIPIAFTATPETLANGELALKVLVHADIRKLPFRPYADRQVERLIFITALFDEKNQFLTGVQGVMDLRLKDATLKRLSAQGLDAKLSIQAPAGTYRVRQVVQEAVSGRISAINRAVTVR